MSSRSIAHECEHTVAQKADAAEREYYARRKLKERIKPLLDQVRVFCGHDTLPALIDAVPGAGWPRCVIHITSGLGYGPARNGIMPSCAHWPHASQSSYQGNRPPPLNPGVATGDFLWSWAVMDAQSLSWSKAARLISRLPIAALRRT